MSRTLTNASYTMTYPNEMHFAFVPAIIKLSNLPTTAKLVTVSLNCAEAHMSFYEEREPYGGESTFDISRLLQIAWANVEQLMPQDDQYNGEISYLNLQKKVDVEVGIQTESEVITVPSFMIRSLFGSIARGQSTGGVIKRRLFVNYPSTIDLYMWERDEISVFVDGGDEQFFYTDDHVVCRVDILKWLKDNSLINVDTFSEIEVYVGDGAVIKNDVQSVGEIIYRLTADRTHGDKYTYLRWVDAQGQFAYYLFKKINSSTAVTAAAWRSSDMSNPTAYDDHNNNTGSNNRQTLTGSKTQNVGVKSVDPETFDLLIGVAQSPIVHVFDGYDSSGKSLWHRVNVTTGTYARSNKPLQDFQIAIVEPEQTTQIL